MNCRTCGRYYPRSAMWCARCHPQTVMFTETEPVSDALPDGLAVGQSVEIKGRDRLYKTGTVVKARAGKVLVSLPSGRTYYFEPKELTALTAGNGGQAAG